MLINNGGLTEAVNKLSLVSSPYAETAGANGAFTSFFGAQPFYLLVVVLLTSLGTWGLPQMVGKFYSIKNEDAIKKGMIISTVFAIVVAGGCYFLGGFGRLYTGLLTDDPSKFKNFDAIIPTMLSTMPDAIIAIVIILVLSASMSTLSSLVLTSSSTLTLDVIVPLKKKTSQKSELLTLRIFIAFFVVVSAALAIIKDLNPGFTFIAQMMGVSWGALAGAFIAPFMYGLYSKRLTRGACWASFISGVLIETVQLIIMIGGYTLPGVLGLIFKNSLYSGVVAMLFGLIIVPLVSLVTPKCDKEKVDEIFGCYEKEVSMPIKDALGK